MFIIWQKIDTYALDKNKNVYVGFIKGEIRVTVSFEK